MRNYKLQITNYKPSGFTLIEMIVAIGIFTVVMTISVGAVLSISAAQKRAIAIQNVQDNIRFAIETISKEARLGIAFHCGITIDEVLTTPRDCATGGPSFTFINARGETVSYQLQSQLINGQLYSQIERWSETDVQFFPITSRNVSIERLRFYVLGSGDSDGIQPRVIITAQGRVDVKGKSVILDLQTTVSQRELDS